jgi:hypothetical protein
MMPQALPTVQEKFALAGYRLKTPLKRSVPTKIV